jgi:hypothetical protein
MEGLPVGNAGVRPRRADRQPDRPHLLLPGNHRHGSWQPEPIANSAPDAVTHPAPDRHTRADTPRDGLPDRQADSFRLRHAIGHPNAASREHGKADSHAQTDAEPVINAFRPPRSAR